jgi:hypothetical protein
MYYYIQLDPNGLVVSVTESSKPIEAENVIETPVPRHEWLGHTYDRENGTATPPAAPEPAPEKHHITNLAFRQRFTRAEKVALEMAALDNPSASLQQRAQAAALRADLKDQEQATYIDLDRADTRAGVQMLEAAGLLGAGRAAQILDAPVQDAERAK